MDNQYSYCYKVRINTADYNYVTANGLFYEFRGEKLLYSTFDSLLEDASLKRLAEHIKAKSYGKTFIMDVLSRNNVTCPMVCYLEPADAEDQVNVFMIEAEKISDRYLALGEKQQVSDALLSQFDSVYFTYNRSENSIVFYRYSEGREQVLLRSDIEGWNRKAVQALSEESQDELAVFDSYLRNGIRTFTGAFVNKSGEKNISYVGTAIYDEEIHVKTVGNIGSTKIKPTYSQVRRDQLTGLILKDDITTYCKKTMAEREKKVALAIIDIDNFKNVNDHFGHAMGDTVLKKCAAILDREVGDYGKAGRIGGDEFLVVFDNFTVIEEIKNILRGIKNNILQAYSEERDGFYVSTSIGCAIYPDDTDNYGTLFDLADHLLYRAKHKGKNRYIIFEKDKHGSVEDVLRADDAEKHGVAGRRGLTKSEAVCRIMDFDISGKEYELDSILHDIMEYFRIERIVVYNKTDRKIELQRGITHPSSEEEACSAIDYLYDSDLGQFYKDNIMVINNIKMFQTKKCDRIYDSMIGQSVFSIMHHEITGSSGKVFVISYEMITKKITWNMEDMYLYRLLDTIFAKRL